MSFYCERWIKKTRKAHVCVWCGQMIEAGSATRYAAGYWEDFWSGHVHPECAAATDAVHDQDGTWEASGEYARGRRDYRFLQPPEFSAAYRGRNVCPPDGTWLTNTVEQYECRWPVRYGDPQTTETHNAEALKRMGMRGVYVCLANGERSTLNAQCSTLKGDCHG